jgi:SPP1 gp7 family putative phage head morphogenesis protein
MTANQDLFDLTLQRQIAVRKYSQDVLEDILDHLTGVDKDLVKKLTGDLTGFQRSRLQSLLKEVTALRSAAWKVLQGETELNLENLAGLEADWEDKALKQVIPIEFNTASINIDAVKAAALAKPFQGATMAQWFTDLATKDAANITRAITMGVTEGQTVDQMIRTLRGTAANSYSDGILSTSRRHAETIVRTATNHVSNTARNEVWEANSDIIRGLRWTSTLDGRTSLVCAGRDGHVAALNGKPLEPGEKVLNPPDVRPPAHPNCRSLMVAVLDGVGMIGDRPTVTDIRTRQKREVDFRAEAKASGKSIQQVRKEWADANVGRAPAATNYETWLRTQPVAFQDQVLGKSRAAMFRSGTPIGDFVTSSGATRKVADIVKSTAAPNVRNYIRRELLKGGELQDVIKSAQKTFPEAGVSPQQVGLIRKSLQNAGMIPSGEVPAGTAQAAKLLTEFQEALPEYIKLAAPEGWADIVQELMGAPPGIHTFYNPGGKVQFAGPLVGKMSTDRIRATYANALGRTLRDQAVGSLDPDLVTSVYKRAQSMELGPLGLSGEVLLDELFGLAINPGALTSWGTQAGPVLIHFADEIKAIQSLLTKALAPKGPVPPAAAAAFPVTGHKTVVSYAKALIAAGKSTEDVIGAVKFHFPDSTINEKLVGTYKAQLAGAKKLAEMPSKAEIDAALKLAEKDPSIKLMMTQLSKGAVLDEATTAAEKAALTLHKAMGSWAKVEVKLQPKVTVAPVSAPGAVPLTKAEISAAEAGWNALGSTSKKAAQSAVAHVKATGSMNGVEDVLAKEFGSFDPVKGKPLIELVKKLSGMDTPPWAKEAAERAAKSAAEAAKKAATDAELNALKNMPLKPKRPASTPAEGLPPPPRFTVQQKQAAVLQEFGMIYKSTVKELSDIEFTVLQRYTGGWYGTVNGKLSRGNYATDYQLQAISEIAQEGIKKLPKSKIKNPLYRNIEVDDLDKFLSRYRVGQVLEETRFTSTSTNGVYGEGSNVRLVFYKYKSARDVSYFSMHKSEREVLFAPGLKLRVKAILNDGYTTIVEVEEV